MQDIFGDAASGSEPLQEVHPLIPFTVRWNSDFPLILLQGSGEQISGKEGIGIIRQAVIHLVENPVLLCSVQVSRKLGQLHLPGLDIPR